MDYGFLPAARRDFIGAIQHLVKYTFANLDSSVPARVLEYDRESRVAKVEPLVRKRIVDAGGDRFENEPPVLVSVLSFAHGGFFIDAPISKGDTGWLFSADRDTTSAKERNAESDASKNEGPQNPIVETMHNFSFGFFMPDSWARIPIADGIDSGDFAIGSSSNSKGRRAYISFSQNGGIKIFADSGIVSSRIEVKGPLKVDGNAKVSGDFDVDGNSRTGKNHSVGRKLFVGDDAAIAGSVVAEGENNRLQDCTRQETEIVSGIERKNGKIVFIFSKSSIFRNKLDETRRIEIYPVQINEDGTVVLTDLNSIEFYADQTVFGDGDPHLQLAGFQGNEVDDDAAPDREDDETTIAEDVEGDASPSHSGDDAVDYKMLIRRMVGGVQKLFYKSIGLFVTGITSDKPLDPVLQGKVVVKGDDTVSASDPYIEADARRQDNAIVLKLHNVSNEPGADAGIVVSQYPLPGNTDHPNGGIELTFQPTQDGQAVGNPTVVDVWNGADGGGGGGGGSGPALSDVDPLGVVPSSGEAKCGISEAASRSDHVHKMPAEVLLTNVGQTITAYKIISANTRLIFDESSHFFFLADGNHFYLRKRLSAGDMPNIINVAGGDGSTGSGTITIGNGAVYQDVLLGYTPTDTPDTSSMKVPTIGWASGKLLTRETDQTIESVKTIRAKSGASSAQLRFQRNSSSNIYQIEIGSYQGQEFFLIYNSSAANPNAGNILVSQGSFMELGGRASVANITQVRLGNGAAQYLLNRIGPTTSGEGTNIATVEWVEKWYLRLLYARASATTLSPTADATADVSLEASVAGGKKDRLVFSFGIPKGERGLRGLQGPAGPAAGFGQPTASVTYGPATSNPNCDINTSGPDTAKIFDFDFTLPGGESDTLDIVTGISWANNKIVATRKQLTIVDGRITAIGSLDNQVIETEQYPP